MSGRVEQRSVRAAGGGGRPWVYWGFIIRSAVGLTVLMLAFVAAACGGGTGAGDGGDAASARAAQGAGSGSERGGAGTAATANAAASRAGASSGPASGGGASSGAAADRAASNGAPASGTAASGAASAGSAPNATASNSSRNPCDLITKAEVEEALGTTVGEPRRRSTICYFPPDGKPMRSVSYAVRWTGGREAMRMNGGVDRLLGSLGDASVQAEIKKAQQRTAAELEGLGDEASFQLVTLKVRKGDAFFSIDARLCSRLQAIAVARKIVDRL